MRFRPVSTAALALAASALALGGCGSSGASGGADPATLAQPDTVVFAEGTIRPTGELRRNLDSVAASIAGAESLRDLVVGELESSAREDGEPFDFATEVEPWLGGRAGVAFEKLVGRELSDPLIAIQSTDAAATQAFVDRRAEGSEDPYAERTYEGIDFRVGGAAGNAIGLIGKWLVLADGERAFERAIDASEGDSLADVDRYRTAISAAAGASFADVYADLGGLLRQSEGEIDDQVKQLLRNAGIDPGDATAVASIVPDANRIEVDLSSELGGEEAPTGDASAMLGSLPASSLAAIAVSGFGGQLEEALESLDESGIPGQIPPGRLSKSLGAVGIDLDRFAGSLSDAGIFVEGNSEASLRGALVATTVNPGQAEETVSSIAALLRTSGAPGVTAIEGRATGFSVLDVGLGDEPLAVVAKGDRISIGYGAAPALKGIVSKPAATLSGTPAYREAVAALGDIPIGGFVDGPAALRLANALVPRSEDAYREARPYLRQISSIGLGSGRDGDLATAKLVVSLEQR